MRRPALVLAVWLTCTSAWAAGSVAVIEPWARVNGQQVEVYLTLHNSGPEQDRLTGAHSPLASGVKLLTTVQLGPVSTVQPLKSIGIPAGSQQVLAPGHTHIELTLKRALAEGESVPLTLQFEKAGDQPLQVERQP